MSPLQRLLRPGRALGCRSIRPLLAEAALDDLADDDTRRLDDHLARCPGCAAELAAFRAAVARVDETAAPPAVDADRLWARLAPRLDAVDAARSAARPAVALRPAWVAAAVVLAFAAGFLLRPEPRPAESDAAPPVAADVAPERATRGVHLDARLARFLDRSTPLVLTVANQAVTVRAGAGNDDVTARRAAALAADAGDLARELDAAGRLREAGLVGDLELVLLQVAHLGDRRDPAALAVVQATLERRAVVFQLAVHELSRPQTTAPARRGHHHA